MYLLIAHYICSTILVLCHMISSRFSKLDSYLISIFDYNHFSVMIIAMLVLFLVDAIDAMKIWNKSLIITMMFCCLVLTDNFGRARGAIVVRRIMEATCLRFCLRIFQYLDDAYKYIWVCYQINVNVRLFMLASQ